MNVVGFDFGTTNSLISVIKGERVINLLDDDGLPFPSVVCYEGAKTIAGREAKERLGEAGLGVKGNTVRSPKILLGRDGVFIEGVERSPVDIVADVVEYISNQASISRRAGKDLKIQRAVVTIPVNMEGYKRKALRDAFRIAGISIVQFVHEPLAALYGFFRSQDNMSASLRQYDRKLILVFDWGGGTLDLTLCRLVDGMLVQIANDGTDDLGGDIFDDLIKNEIVRRVQISRNIDETVEIHPDAEIRLLHQCERAKIDLSNRNKVEIYVPAFFRGLKDEDLEYSLTRDEMNEITSELLNKGFLRIKNLLEASDVSHAQIAVSLATGGMANMPIIKARLHELFGAQRVQISDSSGTLIAEGAAWIANDEAQLHLAKNVELLLARNSYMPIVKAGTSMPSEGEVLKDQFNLYCADPRDGHAKFQINTPVRPGTKVMPNDRRNPLASMILGVDEKAKPFQERIELEIHIDDNLILKSAVKSLNKGEYDEVEIHNLEFGLSLKKKSLTWKEQYELIKLPKQTSRHIPGSLTLRSNITQQKNDTLIPGELLYSYKPGYFDVRSNPPEIQVLEKIYYQPCTLCNRVSNDPMAKSCTQAWFHQNKT